MSFRSTFRKFKTNTVEEELLRPFKIKCKLPVAAGGSCDVGMLERASWSAHLQVLQVSFLGVAEQRGDPVVLPDAAAAAVPPQGEDLPDHRHPPQCTVGKLQDLRVADLLRRVPTQIQSRFPGFDPKSKTK